MIDTTRRTLLKGSLAIGPVGAAVALAPGLLLAGWNQAAFESQDLGSALKNLLGSSAPETNDAVRIKAPDLAENGAVVPVTVETSLPNVTAIAIVAVGNERPLVASFVLGPAALPYVSTRVKMAKTADLIAVVQQGERSFSNTKNVKVTIGGCGG